MDPYRLPRTVVPSRYDLRLEPDLARATFAGSVNIAVDVREPVSEVVLNAAELRITEAVVEGAARQPADRGRDPGRRDGTLPAAFRAGVDEGPMAAEADVHRHAQRQAARLLSQQIQGQARAIRAGWRPRSSRPPTPAAPSPAGTSRPSRPSSSSTLVIDPALQVVSNTAVAEERIENGKKVVRFADTIPMSTYLVAFIVGELEATEPVMVGKTPLRVWCVPGKKAADRLRPRDRRLLAGSLSRSITAANIRATSSTSSPSPTSRPEPWRTSAPSPSARRPCWWIEATATHAERERVADVVAHENAHMWFGDLVTMGWWNGLWLNEAFATFMEMLAVDAWKPEWQRWTTFGVSRSAALAVDGLRSTRPIEFPVEAPKDADAMFDVLTYEKGASVLRMLEQYIGPDGLPRRRPPLPRPPRLRQHRDGRPLAQPSARRRSCRSRRSWTAGYSIRVIR